MSKTITKEEIPMLTVEHLTKKYGKVYKMDDYEINMKYGHCMKMRGRIPEALSGAMANQMYVCNFDTEEEMNQFFEDMAATY